MDWKIVLLIVISLIFFSACGDQDSEVNDQVFISTSNIQHVQIIKDNGNVFPEDDRYYEYSYDYSELPFNALQVIDEIALTTENLYCSNDGVTYEIIITDNDEEVTTYVTNNRDCGRENESLFISVNDIENFLSVLE